MRYLDTGAIPLLRAAAVGAALAALVTACSSSSGSSSAALDSSPVSLASTCITSADAPLAVVLGARSNVPAPSLPSYTDSLVMAAAKAGQPISVIVIGGQPSITRLPLFSSDAGNPEAYTQDLDDYVNYYFPANMAAKYHAQVGQSNVLAALDMAADAAGQNGNIIVVDSGLQTVTPLEYQKSDLLMAPAGDVVSALRQDSLIPDLSGRHVVLSGFGWTASPQPSLNEAQRDNVIAQWKAIVAAGHGCVTASTLPTSAAEIPGLPAVSVVVPPPTPDFTNCGTQALTDAGSVGFKVGTATFRDPSAALATLTRLANTLKQGTEHITLIGSTSTEGGNALNDKLSLERAQAVEKVLVAAHLPGSRISAVGDGSHYPGRVADTGPAGQLLPGPAEQDREVIVQLPPC